MQETELIVNEDNALRSTLERADLLRDDVIYVAFAPHRKPEVLKTGSANGRVIGGYTNPGIDYLLNDVQSLSASSMSGTDIGAIAIYNASAMEALEETRIENLCAYRFKDPENRKDSLIAVCTVRL